MPDPLAGLPPRFLSTREAARFLGLSGRTLEKHRTYGTGPTYRKIGGRVIYALEDLKAWADLGAKQSTSDPGKGPHSPPSGSSQPRPPHERTHACRTPVDQETRREPNPLRPDRPATDHRSSAARRLVRGREHLLPLSAGPGTTTEPSYRA